MNEVIFNSDTHDGL